MQLRRSSDSFRFPEGGLPLKIRSPEQRALLTLDAGKAYRVLFGEYRGNAGKTVNF